MFGFQKIERSADFQHKNNFLQSVTFQLDYNLIEFSDEIYTKLKIILSENFPKNQPLVQAQVKIEQGKAIGTESKNWGIIFSKDDISVQLNISKTQLNYIIQGSNYKNFKLFFEQHSNELNEIINIIQLKKVNRVAIRKVNIINYKKDKESQSLVDILGIMFNSKLIENLKAFPENNNIQRGLNSVFISNKPYNLNLTYGILVDEVNNGVVNGILDIDLFCLEEKEIKEINRTFEIINNEIYNVFSWVLQNDIVNQLSKSS